MTKPPCAIGAAEHNGWAILVSVTVCQGLAEVVDRRRIELIDPGLPKQAYEHETATMSDKDAERLVGEVTRSVARCTERALREVIRELEHRNTVVAFAIRHPTLDRLPATVAQARQSAHIRNRADGMLYHTALCRAAEDLGIEVRMIRRGEELASASAALDVTEHVVTDFLTATGRTLGPPWTADHRRACAGAITVLAEHAALRVSIAAQRPL